MPYPAAELGISRLSTAPIVTTVAAKSSGGPGTCVEEKCTIPRFPMAAPIWRTRWLLRPSPRPRSVRDVGPARRSRDGEAGEAQPEDEAKEGEAGQQGGEGDVRRQHTEAEMSHSQASLRAPDSFGSRTTRVLLLLT